MNLPRRPLFTASLFLAAAIALFPQLFTKPASAGDVSSLASASERSVVLAGRVVGDVTERVTEYGVKKSSFILDVKKVWDESGRPGELSGRVRAHLTASPIVPVTGDLVAFQGRLMAPEGARNPGGFDARAYLERRGVRALFFAEKSAPIKIFDVKRPWTAWFAAIKRALSRSLDAHFAPAEAAYLKALFLGERSGLGDDFQDLFLKTGTTHLLAVSGFNVGFLTFAVMFLFRSLGWHRNAVLSAALAAVWFYCLVVGWQAPLVRAAVMASVLVLSQFLGRKSDLLNALGLAALVILLAKPAQLFDAGFQLSFLAVWAIAVYLPSFLPEEGAPRFIRHLKELFWVSFVCWMATAPLVAATFYSFSPISPLANLVAVPATFVLFLVGILFFITSWLPPALQIFPQVAHAVMSAMVFILERLERLPFSFVSVGGFGVFFFGVLSSGVLFFLGARKFFPKKGARAALAFLFVANLFLARDITRWHTQGFSVTVLDVGQGDAIFLRFPRGGTAFVDAGRGGFSDAGRHIVVPFLRAQGVSTLDALVASHPQADHIGGMPAVLEECRVRYYVESGRSYASETAAHLHRLVERERCRTLRVSEGMELGGFKDARIECFNPPANEKTSVNDSSLVLKVTHGGKAILLTGDIEEPALARLVSVYGDRLAADVLKVSHHGSKEGAAAKPFLDAVSPRASVISVGARNPYGHPAAETLRILNSVPDNRVYRTDLHHAVRFDVENGRLTAQPMGGAREML